MLLRGVGYMTLQYLQPFNLFNLLISYLVYQNNTGKQHGYSICNRNRQAWT
jgi:hypothetical protein